MLVERSVVNFKIYPDVVSNLMKGTINCESLTQAIRTYSPRKSHSPITVLRSFARLKKDNLPYNNITVIKLLKGFKNVFAKDLTELPQKRFFGHRIKIKGSLSKSQSIDRITPLKDQALRGYLKDTIGKSHICSSCAPYGAAVFFVNKKDGDLRLAINYWALNQVTIKNKYLVPRINNLIDSLAGEKYFSVIDLVAG